MLSAGGTRLLFLKHRVLVLLSCTASAHSHFPQPVQKIVSESVVTCKHRAPRWTCTYRRAVLQCELRVRPEQSCGVTANFLVRAEIGWALRTQVRATTSVHPNCDLTDTCFEAESLYCENGNTCYSGALRKLETIKLRTAQSWLTLYVSVGVMAP